MKRIVALLLIAAIPAAGRAQADQSAKAVEAEVERSAREIELLAEAILFMEAYAADLRTGNRAAIAGRYDRSGAWRLGNGNKSFEQWPAIRDHYAGPQWQPPASFEWRDLSYEPAGPDAVVVAGLFRWGAAGGAEPRTYSYTALLVRQDGELRIRLEDESGAPAR